MHPDIAKIIEHLSMHHPAPQLDFDAVIRDCAQRGFSVVQIIAGIQIFYGIRDDVKRLVATHLVWGGAREHWQQFHDDLIEALQIDEEK